MFVFKHFISIVIKKNIFTYKIIVKADTSLSRYREPTKVKYKDFVSFSMFIRINVIEALSSPSTSFKQNSDLCHNQIFLKYQNMKRYQHLINV